LTDHGYLVRVPRDVEAEERHMRFGLEQTVEQSDKEAVQKSQPDSQFCNRRGSTEDRDEENGSQAHRDTEYGELQDQFPVHLAGCLQTAGEQYIGYLRRRVSPQNCW
jgi:hypothetical protein